MVIWQLLLVVYVLNGLKASMGATDPTQRSCCSDGFGLNYTLPMFEQCRERKYKNGSMVRTIPKLIPASPAEEAQCRRRSKIGIPPGRRVCRFPDCLSNPCVNGWCEETMTEYQCHCPVVYTGKRCRKRAKTTASKKMTHVLADTCIPKSPALRTPNTLNTTNEQGPAPITSNNGSTATKPGSTTSNDSLGTTLELGLPTSTASSNRMSATNELQSTPTSAASSTANERVSATTNSSSVASEPQSTPIDGLLTTTHRPPIQQGLSGKNVTCNFGNTSACKANNGQANMTNHGYDGVCNELASCPDGWMPGLQKCYLFLHEVYPLWSPFAEYCETLQSLKFEGVERFPSLLVAESQEEVDILRICVFPQVERTYRRCYWINCRRLSGTSGSTEFSCRTTRNGTTTEFRNWKQAEPNNFGNSQDCVVMESTLERTWNDVRCDGIHLPPLHCLSACQLHVP